MPKKKGDTSFEELYTELEVTIEKLEQGNLSLDESLALYERGMELAKRCSTLLDRAEVRIQELAPDAGAFDPDEPDLECRIGTTMNSLSSARCNRNQPQHQQSETPILYV